MLFDLDDKVIANGQIGTVVHRKWEEFKVQGKIEESMQYYVSFGSYQKRWFHEHELSHPEVFSNEFEDGLLGLLINVNLKVKNMKLVKAFFDQKQALSKRK